ncbi:PH domain-containing protein [Angustibacter luteus]|uniref:PH domain-containing protein n=1 Tax=Angustibacter luteus TaxID=658456 RepID=A0ABW1JFR3_9ACTN
MHRVIRPPLWQRLIQLLALLGFGVLLLAVALSRDTPARYLAEIGAAACFFAAARGWTLRVVVGQEHVFLVNWFRTVAIPWREIQRFGYDGTVWVRCRDSRTHTVSAFSDSGRALAYARRPGRLAAAELEQIRKQRRRQGGARDH